MPLIDAVGSHASPSSIAYGNQSSRFKEIEHMVARSALSRFLSSGLIGMFRASIAVSPDKNSHLEVMLKHYCCCAALLAGVLGATVAFSEDAPPPRVREHSIK